MAILKIPFISVNANLACANATAPLQSPCGDYRGRAVEVLTYAELLIFGSLTTIALVKLMYCVALCSTYKPKKAEKDYVPLIRAESALDNSEPKSVVPVKSRCYMTLKWCDRHVLSMVAILWMSIIGYFTMKAKESLGENACPNAINGIQSECVTTVQNIFNDVSLHLK